MKAKIKIEKFVFTDLESSCASDKEGKGMSFGLIIII